ncbi:catalase [Phreatobacter aquaticus]|uniref:catalase n=1 Tax=Phreatobacter aquaticus TaxID=2570229 RepID=A0A4D7QSZ7_9HYPH|nr:catalase [Phreatobacter aquaticus]QCK88334.1 catalase [Phreatobacter aquaticus]
MAHPVWSETFEGGSAEAEASLFERLARDIRGIQQANRTSQAGPVLRTLHAKAVLAEPSASFTMRADLPSRFAQGAFQPGTSFATIVRLSNASGRLQDDDRRDMRGAALRLTLPGGASHDFLMTNFPVSHARNARQFVDFAKAMAGSKFLLLPRLIAAHGLSETLRMLKNVSQATARPVTSLALETYWSRGALLWGDAGPVRYLLRPAPDALPAETLPPAPERLRQELLGRLSHAPIRFEFCLQPFVDEMRTPIEDGATEWLESVSPPVVVADLVLPVRPAGDGARTPGEAAIEALAFSPWNAADGLRPLGSLNRARKPVYWASADGRGAT